MSVTRTLLLALLLVGGCSHEHAAPTHGHAQAATSGGSARRGDDPRHETSDHSPDHSIAEAERVREARPPTAMDQSETPSDVEITRSIRAAVVDDASLSFAARNVVIITQASVVTLRGSVTHEERRAIHAHAFAAVGVTGVDDQLTVDP